MIEVVETHRSLETTDRRPVLILLPPFERSRSWRGRAICLFEHVCPFLRGGLLSLAGSDFLRHAADQAPPGEWQVNGLGCWA